MRNLLLILVTFFAFNKSQAAEVTHDNHNGTPIYSSFILQGEHGKLKEKSREYLDFKGWIGGDYNKIVLKAERNALKEESKASILFSRNISEFWDAQAGYSYAKEEENSYLTFGFEGMAVFFLETEMHFFIGKAGMLKAELKSEVDIFVTQQLITVPYVSFEFQSKNDHNSKSGLTSFEAGILTRYEFHRKFAPYIALRYLTKTFKTRSFAKEIGENTENYMLSAGLKIKI